MSLPIDPKHPFWFATTGSQMELRLIKPPPSEINSLIVSVYSISEPYTYKVFISQNDPPSPIYCNKKEAIRIIKEDWWQYYGQRTSVNFIEHKNVPLNSCPNSPSPTAVRKNSFKSLLEFKPKSPICSPRTDSDDEKSPRWFQLRSSNSSPRTPRTPRSSNSSPRTPKTPRSSRKNSNTPRSDDDSK